MRNFYLLICGLINNISAIDTSMMPTVTNSISERFHSYFDSHLALKDFEEFTPLIDDSDSEDIIIDYTVMPEFSELNPQFVLSETITSSMRDGDSGFENGVYEENCAFNDFIIGRTCVNEDNNEYNLLCNDSESASSSIEDKGSDDESVDFEDDSDSEDKKNYYTLLKNADSDDVETSETNVKEFMTLNDSDSKKNN
ncbi:uncharacterized protein VNE69_04078 [Vairimorpha necatrix]|uniref:Uncharacterized protein n=1 Tax=Vairimorpha necatrix TaxID=6039 RepID=A0AAX4JBD5_9MICR